MADIAKDPAAIEHAEDIISAKADLPQTVRELLPDWGKPWYKVPHLRKLNLILIFTFLSGIYNGFDNSLLNGLQSVPEWKEFFNSPKGALLGAIANGILYGNIIALFFVSYILDRFGRIKSLGVGATIVVVGVVLQTASQNTAMFVVGRLVLGCGVLVSTTASPLLIAETTYPSHRPYVTGLSQCLYGLGGIVASWTTYGTNLWTNHSNWKWRLPLLLQLMFPIAQLAALYWIPESPRYWVSRGQVDKARKFLEEYHVGNNLELGGQLVEYELAEITYQIQQDQDRKGIKWFEFFKTTANRKRLFILLFLPVMTQLSGNAVLSYFLNLVLNTAGITSSKQQLVFNGGLSVFNFGIGLISLFLVESLGRRRMFLISSTGNCIIFIIFTILSALNVEDNFLNTSLSKAVVAMIFIFYLSFEMGYLAIPTVYQTEILPFHLRAKGYVLHTFVLTGVLLFNGFVTPIAMGKISWKYYILYCCINAVEVVVIYFFFPETKGLSLEEVAAVFGEVVLPFHGNSPAAKRVSSLVV